ncbi:copper resistance-associated p-type ATPase [Dactylonectria macrodidyma]|uniref:Copper resistance-associated p-type ATPase n=1 Tax=Dactylonectria macrodidyma TaxID=307937 RepID=A0A9P9IMG5_9HYPO|nr:copper resistance-associated p-type ATPase [Dactylonectria macrodidyma]
MLPATQPGCGPSGALITSLLISNFHCPSCIPTIRKALQKSFIRHISWISPNLVTSVVTVEHGAVASSADMKSALEEFGFEVSAMATSPSTPTATGQQDPGAAETAEDESWHTFNLVAWTACSAASGHSAADREQRAKVHLQSCEKCQLSKRNGETPAPSTSTALNRTSEAEGAAKASSKHLVIAGTTGEVIPEGRRRATLAVRGMTCAVCVNAITDELGRLEGVVDAVVSLMSNSATVTFDGNARVPQIVEAIEDLGYEATVDNVTNLGEQGIEGIVTTEERIVDIKLDGIYCPQCPSRVARSLAGFRRQLAIVGMPTSVQNPVIQVRYLPDAPGFTVRRIIEAIEASDEAIRASVYHAPTIEERSRQIRRRYQRQLLYRVTLTAIICIPTFVIGIVYMNLLSDSNAGKSYLMAPLASGIGRGQFALLALATPVYFCAADAFHAKAIKEIQALWRRGSRTPVLQRFYRFGSMNTLMSLGTTIAYVASVAQLIAAGVNHTTELSNADLYFDSVVFLTFFILLGRVIESLSKARAGDAVEMLGKLRPTTAMLVERLNDGEEGEEKVSVVQADLLDLGDLVRVPHGGSPPVATVRKRAHDLVFSGTVNKGAPVLIRITGVAGRSMLDQIVDAVREGQTKRAPVEQIADVMTAYFVPAITLTAILTWLTWMSLGWAGRLPVNWLDVTSGGWVAWSLQFAIGVFVVACPCGLALAAPTAVFVGGGLAARHGILAKGGGEAFEKASKVDTVMFDKTGTLTLGGEPSITDAEFYVDGDDAWKATLLAAVKAVEENSTHPVAKAVAIYSASEASSSVIIGNLNEIPGKGMAATCSSLAAPDAQFEILVGSEALLADFSVDIPQAVTTILERWKTEAKSIALVAYKRMSSRGTGSPLNHPSPHVLAAAFAVSDPIRPEAPAIVRALHARGVAVWLLSGDNVLTASAVAARVGIRADRVMAGMLPTQKAAALERLRRGTEAGGGSTAAPRRVPVIAMVGDGVNDAPALTAADVGVAMESGADVALGAADFVLLLPDLRGVLNLLDLSRAILRRIKVNFGWAVVYNVITIPIAAGCLYPIPNNGQHVRLDPVWASLAMALSSISVVTSSLALRSPIPGLGFRVKKIADEIADMA